MSYSYVINRQNQVVHVSKGIFENEIVDITDVVTNAFCYTENRSNKVTPPKDRYHKKLLPFYDDMIKNAVNRLYGSNLICTSLPQHPKAVVEEFKHDTPYNHFYAMTIHSMLSYLIQRYWNHMLVKTGITSSSFAYDYYRIPLNRASTLNYLAFRGDEERNSDQLLNRFLFGGVKGDKSLLGMHNFLKWTNRDLKEHPVSIDGLKHAYINIKKSESKIIK